MNLIPSFVIDHRRIVPGIFVSRVDEIGLEHCTTFDVRMKRPNVEPAISPEAMHTIEHVIATYLRNKPDFQNQLIYWGNMGCNTGFYMIVKGDRKPEDVYPVILEAFQYLSDYRGEVPGATEINCGNYHLHNLEMARWEAREYLYHLRHDDFKYMFTYPKTEKMEVNGQKFFDS